MNISELGRTIGRSANTLKNRLTPKGQETGLSRRDFLKGTVLVGTGIYTGLLSPASLVRASRVRNESIGPSGEPKLQEIEAIDTGFALPEYSLDVTTELGSFIANSDAVERMGRIPAGVADEPFEIPVTLKPDGSVDFLDYDPTSRLGEKLTLLLQGAQQALPTGSQINIGFNVRVEQNSNVPIENNKVVAVAPYLRFKSDFASQNIYYTAGSVLALDETDGVHWLIKTPGIEDPETGTQSDVRPKRLTDEDHIYYSTAMQNKYGTNVPLQNRGTLLLGQYVQYAGEDHSRLAIGITSYRSFDFIDGFDQTNATIYATPTATPTEEAGTVHAGLQPVTNDDDKNALKVMFPDASNISYSSYVAVATKQTDQGIQYYYAAKDKAAGSFSFVPAREAPLNIVGPQMSPIRDVNLLERPESRFLSYSETEVDGQRIVIGSTIPGKEISPINGQLLAEYARTEGVDIDIQRPMSIELREFSVDQIHAYVNSLPEGLRPRYELLNDDAGFIIPPVAQSIQNGIETYVLYVNPNDPYIEQELSLFILGALKYRRDTSAPQGPLPNGLYRIISNRGEREFRPFVTLVNN